MRVPHEHRLVRTDSTRPSLISRLRVAMPKENVLQQHDKELTHPGHLCSSRRPWIARTSELNAADEAPAQRNAEPYVGKKHCPHKTMGNILRPPYGTTPRDRFTAGSATYRPTFVRDHGNTLRMRHRTVTRNYATGPYTHARADRTPYAEPPLPPYGTDLNVHTTPQPASPKEGRVWT